jgi:hypothetical protein
MAGKKKAGNKTSGALVRQVQSAVDSAVAKLQSSGSGTSKKRNKRKSADAVVAVGMGSVTVNQATFNGSSNCTIRNTEYVTDVTWDGSSTGPVYSCDINPAAPTFAWLSRIAGCYEMFRVKSLSFKFTPTCSSQTAGVIVMAYDYDSSDAAPTAKQQISAFGGSKRGNVWNALEAKIQATGGWRYVGQITGSTINPTGTDIKLYDVAKFYVALYNMSSAATVGDLSVSYEIEFAKPEWNAVLPSLSELVKPLGSTVSEPAGTGFSVYTGSLPVTMSKVTSGGTFGIKIEFPKPGAFLLNLLDVLQHPSTATSAYSSVEYYPSKSFVGPGTVISPLAGFTSAWVNPSADYYDMWDYAVSVIAGSYLIFWVVPTLSKFQLRELRIASYATLQ